MKFSSEQLNFFKFSTVVLDEFPVALRLVFVFMWDTLVATTPGIPKWDDSVAIRNMLLAKEGGKTKYVPTSKSINEWDCTALFEATLFAKTFSMPSTLHTLYVRPRGLSAGTFHHSVISPTGKHAEMFALALDQLRLLRNTLCHQISTQKIDKVTFDHYILLAKDAFTALGQTTTRIDEIGKLAEEDFPTARLKQVEDELQREKDAAIKFTQIDDHLKEIGSRMKYVGLAVRSDLADVKKMQLETFWLLWTFLKVVYFANRDLKQAMQTESSKGLLFPDSCVPHKIPHFIGRQEGCQAILYHLTNEDTRLVNVWGPPGFGKTSVAINVAHHLHEMKIPVYFTSLRGMKSSGELVSKLLSIFTDAKQTPNIIPSHWLLQSLQKLDSRFVLILDNADDLLESGDARLKEDVLGFTEKILVQCSHIKLVFTTRESLDYLSYKLPIHQERVGVLEEVSSMNLVQSLLPDVSDDYCNCIVKACGQVPLAMRLMCSIVTEQRVTVEELLEELKVSPLVKVLDNESFSDDVRLKILFNTSFQRLTDHEKKAFVSLAVFTGCFGVNEAKSVLNLKTFSQTKKKIGSLKRKSLIQCSANFESFTIHPLLRSFIEEKRTTDKETEAVFRTAKRRLYLYRIFSFGLAIKKFLTSRSNEALVAFLRLRESNIQIISSLIDGAKVLYHKVVEVMSKAELFFFAILPDEELLLRTLSDMVVEEARKRQNVDDERKVLAPKSFGRWDWFSSDYQFWNFSFHFDEGISLLKSSITCLGSRCDKTVFKVLACQLLVVSQMEKQGDRMALQFLDLCRSYVRAGSASVGGLPLSLSRDSYSPVTVDATLLSVTTNLIHLFLSKTQGTGPVAFHSRETFTEQFFRERFGSTSKAHIKQARAILWLITRELKKMKAEVNNGRSNRRIGSLVLVSRVTRRIPDQSKSLITFNRIDKYFYFLERNFPSEEMLTSQFPRNYASSLTQPIKNLENIMKSLGNDLDVDEFARGYDILANLLQIMYYFSGALRSAGHTI